MIGIRVIKSALAATVAVYLANFFQLDSYLAAGILAILSVDVTRRRHVQSAAQRLLASLLGLVLAALLFESLGYQLWVLGLFVAIAFPLLAAVHLKDGIVTGSVIVFHVFAAGQISLPILYNEICLLLLGIGTATVINFIYMPNEEGRLLAYRRSIEQYFTMILREIADFLRNAESTWSGEQLLLVERTLDEASVVACRVTDNDLLGQERFRWYDYIQMRREQLDSLRQMLTLVAQVSDVLPQGRRLADLFERLCAEITADHYEGHVERALQQLIDEYRDMPLPASRDEFESRSALLQLTVELRRFLAIAREKKKTHHRLKKSL